MDTPNLNKEWHKAHPMPRNATLEERINWHLEHHMNCSCREIPAQIRDEIRKRRQKPK